MCMFTEGLMWVNKVNPVFYEEKDPILGSARYVGWKEWEAYRVTQKMAKAMPNEKLGRGEKNGAL